MARVTVEDCLDVVHNRFDLVLRAARRARELSGGAPVTIDRDNDKDSVIALREIAEGSVDSDVLEEAIIKSMQRHVVMDAEDADLDSEFEEAILKSNLQSLDEGMDVTSKQAIQSDAESRLMEEANTADQLSEEGEALKEGSAADEALEEDLSEK